MRRREVLLIVGVFLLLFALFAAFPSPAAMKKARSKPVETSQPFLTYGGRPTDEPQWIRDCRKTLATKKVTFNFMSTPLDDVVQFLQDSTNVNIAVSKAIDGKKVKVDLSLNNVIALNALEIILQQTDLDVRCKNETLVITPKAPADAFVLDIYDVQDLIGDDPEKLEATIKRRTADEEAWTDPASYELHRGQIIVNQTKAVHDEIRDVLASLRKRAAPPAPPVPGRTVIFDGGQK